MLFVGCLVLMLWVLSTGILSAAEPRLLAPVYPNAKRFNGASGDDCERNGSNCKYVTRDAIKKVKDFYAGKFGAEQVFDHSNLRGHPAALVPLESFYVNGEMGSGWVFTGVYIEGLVTPAWPGSDAKAEELIRSLEKFNGFSEAVNWTRAEGLGFNGLYTIEQMKALFQKYAYLEARYYPTDVDGNRLDQVLLAKYSGLAEQREEQARQNSEARQERANMNMRQDMNAKFAEAQRNMAQGGSAQDKQENAEMEALLKRKPKLRAQLNPLSKKMREEMQAGKMDEAEATGDQMDKLMRSDKEVAALLDRQEQRSRAEGAKGAANVQQFMQSMTDMQHASVKEIADAKWNTWREFLEDLARQSQFVSLITIHPPDDDPKKIRDRAAVLKKYREEVAKNGGKAPEGGRFIEGEQSASTPASSQQADSAKSDPKPAKEKKQPTAKKEDKSKDPLGDAAKQGMNLLKKLF